MPCCRRGFNQMLTLAYIGKREHFFLSETTKYRALYWYVCSNYAPVAKNSPTP